MKKTNSSEDNLDDADELRKKKLKTDVVTDQMVPLPESSPLRKEEEREGVESKPVEKSEEINLFLNKQCKDETRDLLDLESMYEDVNSPEDFDDYDDLDQECSNSENVIDNSRTDKSDNNIVEDSANSGSVSQEPKTCIGNDLKGNEKIDHKQGSGIASADNVSLEHEQDNNIAEVTANDINLDCGQETFVADITENVSEDHKLKENCIVDSAENASTDHLENYMVDDTDEDVVLDCEPKNCIANNAEEVGISDQEPENYIADDTEEVIILDHESENHVAEDVVDNSNIDHERGNYIAEDSAEIASVIHEPENYITEDLAENASVVHKPEKYITEEIAVCYEAKGTNVSCKTVISKNVEKENTQDLYIVEDCSLPSSDASLVRRDESPLGEPAPTICSTASMEEEDLIDGDAEGDEDVVEREVDNVGYSLNTEDAIMHDPIESQMDYTVTAGGTGIVPEVEDVTCDSGGDTVLVMNRELCPEGFSVSKQSKLCTVEEIGYTDPLNTVESVDEMIFQPRNSVIETANASASLHANDSRAMKCGDNRFLCELPVRETMGVAKYHGSYANVGVNSVLPKRVYNTVHISSVSEPSDNELYGYDSSIQNMLCRNNTVIDASTVPVTSNVNGLETYSFLRVPDESSSRIRNMNDSYGHSNPGFCPVIQNSKSEFSNTNVTSSRKTLPAEEDFMRRIEKTLFESKIENKIENTVDSKYKSEVDLSLPLKKRLRTLAAISNPEKFVAPKEESFPSYPANPMISIAELEYTEALIRKPGNIYRDNYK